MHIGVDVSDLATNRADGTTRYTREVAQRLPELTQTDRWTYFAPADFTLAVSASVSKKIAPFPKYWTQLRLPIEIYRTAPDVLFMPIQQLPYIRPAKVKTVAVIHDLAFHYYPEQFTYKDWLLLHTFTAYVARQADQIITVSEATAQDVANHYGRTENVHVIHHGVDHAQFRPPSATERQISWRTLTAAYPKLKKPYVLYVGQIQPRKNLERLVGAFEQLSPIVAEQLVIAGGHGWLQHEFRAKVTTSPRRTDIYQLGRIDDALLPALYWHADVFTLPSLYEGFGLPLLEALACECPVVTSNVSSMPEVVGHAAVLIDPTNSDDIARGIQKAHTDREILQLTGRQQAARFTWQSTAERTLEVLRQAGHA